MRTHGPNLTLPNENGGNITIEKGAAISPDNPHYYSPATPLSVIDSGYFDFEQGCECSLNIPYVSFVNSNTC